MFFRLAKEQRYINMGKTKLPDFLHSYERQNAFSPSFVFQLQGLCHLNILRDSEHLFVDRAFHFIFKLEKQELC